MNKKKLFLAPVALLLAIALSGCASTTVAHPNQISAFDGLAYDTLITAQGGIKQAKAIYCGPADPGTCLTPQYPQFKAELNGAINAYDAAIAAYKLYHAQGAGAPTVAVLQGQVNDLVASVAKLLASLGVKL